MGALHWLSWHPNWVYMSESGTPTSQTTDIFAKFPAPGLQNFAVVCEEFAAMFWWMLTILTVALGLRPENVMEDEPLPCNERTQVVPAEMSKCLNTGSYGGTPPKFNMEPENDGFQ